MTFLSPIWLYGLLSLILPLAIHLFSRKPAHTYPVGSLQPFLGATSRRPRRLKLQNFWRMLLRMLLLGCLFLWLAEPAWEQQAQERKRQLILLHPDTPKELLNTLLNEKEPEIRWLLPGLPSIQDSLKDEASKDIWVLLAQADALPNQKDTLWVVSPLEQGLFGKQRPALRHAVVFMTFEPAREQPYRQFASSIRFRARTQDSIQYWEVDSTGELNPQYQKTPFPILLAYQKQYAEDANLLATALQTAALASPHLQLSITPIALPVDSLPKGQLLWLSKEEPSHKAWLRYRAMPSRNWVLTLNRQPVLTKLPAQYRQQPHELGKLPLELSSLFPAMPLENQLPMTEAQAMPVYAKGKVSDPQAIVLLAPYFLVLFLLLLLLERWWMRKPI